MNESELRKFCLEHAGEPLPADAEALIQRDPELKRQVNQLLTVKKLMGLKKYEAPHPACVQRCMRNVAARIEAQQQGGWLVRLREWTTLESPAAVRWAYAAALVACVAGVTMVQLNKSEPASVVVATTEVNESAWQNNSVAAVDTEINAEVAEAMPVESVAAAFPEFEKPLIVLQVDSNPQPSTPRLQFGPGMSVPVNYDF